MMPRTFLFLLLCAGIGYLVGRSRGMGLQGFFFGLAFGPLGWGLILLWPRSWVQGPVPREAAGAEEYDRVRPDRRAGPRPPPRHGQGENPASGACPRCGSPAERDAGACPNCGNILLPVHYAVEPGDR